MQPGDYTYGTAPGNSDPEVVSRAKAMASEELEISLARQGRANEGWLGASAPRAEVPPGPPAGRIPGGMRPGSEQSAPRGMLGADAGGLRKLRQTAGRRDEEPAGDPCRPRGWFLGETRAKGGERGGPGRT